MNTANNAFGMHPRNVHKHGYPMDKLCVAYPELRRYCVTAKSGKQSIDFANPAAVKALNAALLIHYYGLNVWDIPTGYLCPPVPGRADYIHGIADVLAQQRGGKVPTGNKIKGLDIGTGANAIYPIIGSQQYGWRFVGTDIDKVSVKSATALAANNPSLKPLFTVRQQSDKDKIFEGVVRPNEHFTFSMCNPPFHKSAKDAARGSLRKAKGLQRNKRKRTTSSEQHHRTPILNFAGTSNELWCEGGELAFIQKMISESVNVKHQIDWFTCLVSKSEHLKAIQASANYHGATQFIKVDMGQGNKISRFVAWTF